MNALLSPADLQAIMLTLTLCLWTTVILLLISTPLAWWLAQGNGRRHRIVQALVALPLVLPPTVLGFYLLVLLGPHGAIGATLQHWGLPHLAFTFEGILIGSVIYSLPFAVQPLYQAFRALDRDSLDIAATLGAGRLDRFLHVILPGCASGFITAMALSFAHTLGEFGVVLMLGGSLPGETRVMSIQIYDQVEALQYGSAHLLSLSMVVIAVIALYLIYTVQDRHAAREH